MNTLTVTLAEREVLLDRLLEDGVAIAHDCGGALACSSCAVVISEGGQDLPAAGEDELDLLDRGDVAAPGARLACQVSGAAELVVAIPSRELPPAVTESRLPVTMSEPAARFLARQLAAQPGAVAVRLGIVPSGCSGFGYRVEHAMAIGESDALFEARGVRIAVDAASLPFVQGTTIDLVKEGLSSRLRFDNPNARQSCGCGESFGV
ncbi:MAG TPA: iron-sulfur cluster assembly accessory protein [Burkholderiales bacterium]|nr:iron-sulfur cluster assembly accessory protein [Burkholderiales bacterium]